MASHPGVQPGPFKRKKNPVVLRGSSHIGDIADAMARKRRGNTHNGKHVSPTSSTGRAVTAAKFREVKNENIARGQKIAIALSKARAAGVLIPKRKR